VLRLTDRKLLLAPSAFWPSRMKPNTSGSIAQSDKSGSKCQTQPPCEDWARTRGVRGVLARSRKLKVAKKTPRS
jgi:hypothetical protein